MDPVAPIVIHPPEIPPVARAAGAAPIGRDGGRRGGGRQADDRRRDRAEADADESDQDGLEAGPEAPRLLDVIADESDAPKALPPVPGAGHIDVTA